jgi:uroporphyrinogen-III synthase
MAAAARDADAVLFTSPNAVRAAAAIGLRQQRDAPWLAVGAGTAAALRRAGVAAVTAPSRMDSEGLLALPALHDVRGRDVGLVTAPGGRGVIAATLARRGARVLRANVYERVPVSPSPGAIRALQALEVRPWLALSSGEALEHVLATLPTPALRVFRRARVLAASERLATLARGHGFDDVRIATDARPRALLDAALRPGG